MRINLALLATCAVLGLTGVSTSTQAASSMCNVFANPWPSLESEDGSPPSLDLHNPACAMSAPAAAAKSIQSKHVGQAAQLKHTVPATSAHS